MNLAHALGIGMENLPGLFRQLVLSRLWRHLAQADEDRANVRIEAFLRGPEPPLVNSSAPRSPVGPVLSVDAKMALRVRAALAAKGDRGDLYPQVRRQDPSWTRERRDLALGELGW